MDHSSHSVGAGIDREEIAFRIGEGGAFASGNIHGRLYRDDTFLLETAQDFIRIVTEKQPGSIATNIAFSIFAVLEDQQAATWKEEFHIIRAVEQGLSEFENIAIEGFNF